MTMQVVLTVLFLGCVCSTYAQNFYVIAPSTLRLNADETIAVAVDGGQGALVNVYIQDHPGKIKNITTNIMEVQSGKPEVFKVRLDPENFPPNFLSSPGHPKMVSLTAQSDKFQKEIIIPITTQSGYVFIQTDKPIYKPNENVHIRIISLNEEVTMSDKDFKLQIMNPKSIILKEILIDGRKYHSEKTETTQIYNFPKYPELGEWSATVLYGYNFQLKSTVHFELQEYVLPTFAVQLQTPDVILPSHDKIKIGVVAKHVYGKKVQGVVTFRLGVKLKTGNITMFGVFGPKKLHEGSYQLRIDTEDLKTSIGWFPKIHDCRLFVEATVVDDGTGTKETVEDSKGHFSQSPFTISFKECLRNFHPGHNSLFEAHIFYVDDKPASGIYTKIRATADGKPLIVTKDTAVSDEEGKVSFEIQLEVHYNTVSVTVETIDPKYVGSQAVGHFNQTKVSSSNDAYISIFRSTAQRLKPTEMFSKLISFKPESEIRDIYYVVVSKGKIIIMDKLQSGDFRGQVVKFGVTYEMVPSFRLIVFAQYKDKLLADSLKVPVERVCDPTAKVSVEAVYNIKEPAHEGKFVINGDPGTFVGLLCVDEAVYALSKKDLLSKAKMFDKLASHDLGCGPGGGLNVDSVLGNAGIVVATNNYSPSMGHTCEEIKRRKREVAVDIVSTYTGLERECCGLGIAHDKHNRNCQERTEVVEKQLQGEHQNCSEAFLECCLYAEEHGIIDMKYMRKFARIGGDDDAPELDFDMVIDEDLSQRNVRRDFREKWLFENFEIKSSKRIEYGASLPHSITTWVIQAVSVSKNHGMCVTEPQKLVSFKKIFLQLNLPYSVVRNEQVEIRATVFNYGSKKIAATVYMYGVEDLCTGTQPGKRSERKRFYIDRESAQSVSFPVIPLKAQVFTITVVVLTPEGSDIVEKQLRVVPEGVTKEIHIPVLLDPTNQQNRLRRELNDGLKNDSFDSSRNLQVTTIKLCVPEEFVPGTVSCSITAIGDQMGAVVETAITNPDSLILEPIGCGEQNMKFLAPTLYTMRYLKITGKLTAAREEKGYEFLRLGYGNQLKYRKSDGSYAALPERPTSTWLTAFVMKVFCQANELIFIDENILCSGVRWLINNQQEDGSYLESYPVIASSMMGGVQGSTPLTAFVLIALEECNCDEENLFLAKQRALAYLESHLEKLSMPLHVAIAAYALALTDSDHKQIINDKLISMARIDEGANMMFWETENSAQDVETAGYALLTQLLFQDMTKSTSIVNWLNTKRLQSGSYESTQDTVVALQSLSEYAIRARYPPLNLIANISSSNDRNFHEVLRFHEENALVLQDVKVDKVGGTLFINTIGQGVGSMGVKLRYNLIQPPEKICRFDISINITDVTNQQVNRVATGRASFDSRRKSTSNNYRNVTNGISKALDEDVPVWDFDPRNRNSPRSFRHISEESSSRNAKLRVKRQTQVIHSNIKYEISICVRYLGNQDTGMSIVDVGVFSGFEPDVEELDLIQGDPHHLIQLYEKSSRGVVFYLEKVPTQKNYCFSFPITREYIVQNTQMSTIKVYDYYRPNETCTKFYSPDSNSPVLRRICDGGICQCLEGGCASNKALLQAGLHKNNTALSRDEYRKKILEMACDNYDYVWMGSLTKPVINFGGFLNISFFVDDVTKAGIEELNLVEKDSRIMLARDDCPTLLPGVTYLIMGKDGQKYQNRNGVKWYRYLLDQTSVVHTWTPLRDARVEHKELQRALNYAMKKLKENGCLQ